MTIFETLEAAQAALADRVRGWPRASVHATYTHLDCTLDLETEAELVQEGVLHPRGDTAGGQPGAKRRGYVICLRPVGIDFARGERDGLLSRGRRLGLSPEP